MDVLGDTVGEYLSGDSNDDVESMESVYGKNRSLLDSLPSMPSRDSVELPELEPSSQKKQRTEPEGARETQSSEEINTPGRIQDSLNNLWDSVKEAKPGYSVEAPEINIGRDRNSQPDSLLRDRGFQTGLGVGGGYLLLNNLFSHMSEQGGKVGEIGSDALDYTQDVVYRDIADFSQADNFVDTMMSTSDYWVHGIANYGIGKAGCHAVDKITDEHDPKKTALGGLASVAAFTVFKEGYVQGQDLEFALNNFDTQGDIIMNTAGGLYGIHKYEKQMAAEGETETDNQLQEAVNNMAYELGQKYGDLENSYDEMKDELEESFYETIAS